MWLPVVHSWRLNERHYGALQGLNKAETAAKFGEEQVLKWRRAYAVAPPPLPAFRSQTDRRRPALQTRTRHTKCRHREPERHRRARDSVLERLDRARDSARPACFGHRTWQLVTGADQASRSRFRRRNRALNVPTARPLVYELDSELKPIRHYYLGDAAEIARAVQAVAAQGQAKDRVNDRQPILRRACGERNAVSRCRTHG